MEKNLLDLTGLEHSNYLNKAIHEIVDYAIVLLDCDGNILEWNKGAENIKGYRSSEIIGQNFRLFYQQEDREAFKPEGLLLQALEEGRVQVEGWRVRKDKSLFWASVTITSFFDDNGILIGYIKVTRDLSEKKKAENQIEKLVQKLTHQNAQLLNFAHITSHNLRAPVSNINSLLAIYENAESDEEREELFNNFKIVASHLSNTLNELVDALLIREDTEKEREWVDFQAVYSKTTELLSQQIKELGVTLNSDFSAVKECFYPVSYMDSIFLNLISNAIKFSSPERAPIISVKTCLTDKGVSLIVQDNGLGINLERNKHKMFGLHKTFHRVKDSKGIGLFMTKSQIEAMGGSIHVESTENVGSTFTVVFNLKKE